MVHCVERSMPEISQLNHAPEVYSSIWHFLFLSVKHLEICPYTLCQLYKVMNTEAHTNVFSCYLRDADQKFQWKPCQGDESQILFPSCAVKQCPSWSVPSVSARRQQLTEGNARLSAGSKLFLRWALYLQAGIRVDLGMLTLQPHKGSNCLHLRQCRGNLHAFPTQNPGSNPKANQANQFWIRVLDT